MSRRDLPILAVLGLAPIFGCSSAPDAIPERNLWAGDEQPVAESVESQTTTPTTTSEPTPDAPSAPAVEPAPRPVSESTPPEPTPRTEDEPNDEPIVQRSAPPRPAERSTPRVPAPKVDVRPQPKPAAPIDLTEVYSAMRRDIRDGDLTAAQRRFATARDQATTAAARGDERAADLLLLGGFVQSMLDRDATKSR